MPTALRRHSKRTLNARSNTMSACSRTFRPCLTESFRRTSSALEGKGLNAANFLKNNDSQEFFNRLGDVWLSGPIGTDVDGFHGSSLTTRIPAGNKVKG